MTGGQGQRVTISLTVRQARMVGVVLSEMADVTMDDSVRRDCVQIGRRIRAAIEKPVTPAPRPGGRRNQ